MVNGLYDRVFWRKSLLGQLGVTSCDFKANAKYAVFVVNARVVLYFSFNTNCSFYQILTVD